MTRQAILIGFTLWVLNATAPPYKPQGSRQRRSD
jgi:hypothetical protein